MDAFPTSVFILSLFPQFVYQLIYWFAAHKIQQLSVEDFIVFQGGDGGFRDRGFGWAIAALPKLLIVCLGKYQSPPTHYCAVHVALETRSARNQGSLPPSAARRFGGLRDLARCCWFGS